MVGTAWFHRFVSILHVFRFYAVFAAEHENLPSNRNSKQKFDKTRDTVSLDKILKNSPDILFDRFFVREHMKIASANASIEAKNEIKS